MGKTRPFSIYLMKARSGAAQDFVKAERDIHRLPIRQGSHTIGTLFYRSARERAPRWLSFFQSHVEPAAFAVSSIAAVFLVRTAGRWFALTFGQGRHLLAPEMSEESFGLRVTLNSVNPNQIRVIERQALDATGRHSREQASRNIPIIEFGLDIENDILRAVTGPPEDTQLGTRLSGADALAVVADITLDNVREALDRYLRQYQKRTYQKRFPWVENVREVGDVSVARDLDEAIQDRIRRRQLECIWLAVPDLISWDEIEGFGYSVGPGELYDDIGFETYLNHVPNPDHLTIADLRRHRVEARSAENGAPRMVWSVYKCVYAEVDRGDKTFLLTRGRWYEIASQYVEDVNRAIRRIPTSRRLHLPEYIDRSEEDYNERVATEENGYALMDRKTIRYGGGTSKIEFCDLYTTRREMVHVKRYAGSGTLSHLFAQGVVSASLFLNDSQFRAEVNRVLPRSHKLRTLAQLRASDYEVAYAIVSKSATPLDLPFFSRVTLRSSYTQLRNMGYQVSLNKILCRPARQ